MKNARNRLEWKGMGLDRALLGGLMALLPFEPRRPVFGIVGFQITLLEALAGAACLGLLWVNRRRLGSLLAHPPLPLVGITLLAGAHAVSAWQAPGHNDLAFKFAGRMAMMAGFAWLVAATRQAPRHAGLVGLAAGASVVAVLAILEGMGFERADAVLDRFREMPFGVAEARRASGASEYPNLAAGFLAYGLTIGVGLLSAPRRMGWVLPACALFSVGLLFTYSRGGLLAAGAGLLTLGLLFGFRQPRRARTPLVALAVLLALCGAFAASGDVFRLRLSSEGPESWYGALYKPLERSLSLKPGENHRTTVDVVNSGRKTWGAEEGFHLSYHWYGSGWDRLVDGSRARLPRDLSPGETVRLETEIRAPDQEGRYLLVWDMVRGHATWFSGQGVSPNAVPVVIASVKVRDDTDFGTAPVPAVGWRPSRRELWSLAGAMWRQHPMTGVGSDNFRRLYGPWAGRPFWDARVYSNNLFLETAATTGALGLLALVATLAAAAIRSGRCALVARSDAPEGPCGSVLLALTLALCAHGMVDYLQAFTGHYLVLGFLVGASAALPHRGVGP